MAIAFVASAIAAAGSATSFTITVPAAVQVDNLGIIVVTTAGGGGVAGWTIDGWTSRVENPPGQGDSDFGLFTRLSGHVPGETLTVKSDAARTTSVSAIWLNTNGRDISIVGAPGTRNGVSAATLSIPGITASAAGQDVIVVSTERTQVEPTVITGWAPSTPTSLYFQEFVPTWSTHYVGYFLAASAGAVPARTVTYDDAGTSAAGVMLGVKPSVGGWIKDPAAPGGKRAFIRRRNRQDGDAIDGGQFAEANFTSGTYDGGNPNTGDFFDSVVDGGDVSG